jgi:hypothetical protein
MTDFTHPEQEIFNSLTAPADRPAEPPKYRPNLGVTMSDEQVSSAMDGLIINELTKFPRVEKRFADPPISGQNICIHSFVPSKGATSDKDGIYGMVKFRGAFATEREAMEHSEHIIRNVDSYHSLYFSHMGRPFPLTRESKYVADVTEIDIRKKTEEIINEDVKKKRQEEKQAVEDVKRREKELLEDVSKDEEPIDRYTTLQVKRAQLAWTYVETMKKLQSEVKNNILKARSEISEMDEKYPDLRDKYVDKYMEARKQAGLRDDDNSFMKYLTVDPEELGF